MVVVQKKKTMPDNKKMNIKTICIGNFYIGGTGKTSLCIKINKILNKRKIKSCFIKKFYKNTLRLKTFPKFFIPFFKWRLHRLGIRKIPKIKATYKSLLITIDD